MDKKYECIDIFALITLRYILPIFCESWNLSMYWIHIKLNCLDQWKKIICTFFKSKFDFLS